MTSQSTPLDSKDHWDGRHGDLLESKIVDDLSERPISWKGPSIISSFLSAIKYYAYVVSISVFIFFVYCLVKTDNLGLFVELTLTIPIIFFNVFCIVSLYRRSVKEIIRGGDIYRDVIKRFLDIVTSSIMIVLLAPVLAVICVLVMIDGGPALYGHLRVGKDGKLFRCLKFRSMALEKDTTLQGRRANPRVTRVGRWLRATSLDELPQLFNVLRGDMSLVGPRPAVSVEVFKIYGEAAPDYMSVRPGVTGLWRIESGNQDNHRTRLEMDSNHVRYYAKHMSVGQDFRILLLTLLNGFRQRSAL